MKRYAIWAAILFMTGGAHAQDVIKQDVSAKTVTEAKVGDVLLRKGSVETIKIDASGKLNTKVFAAPQWDQTGKPLVQYDAATGKIQAKSRYVRFVSDEATGKLTVDKQVSETGVKEFYTVPDNKTSKLSWTVDTDAETVTWDNAGKRLIFYGFDGLYMFESPPPVAWDADKKPVGVTAEYDKGVLTYTILPGEYKYPVTVDPSTTVNAGSGSGRICSAHASYTTARDATSGVEALTNGFIIGQDNTSYYTVYRSFLNFSIPNMSTCSACTLYLYYSTDQSTIDFNINVYGATAYGTTLTTADFSLFNGWKSSGAYDGTVLNNTWSSSAYTVWNPIIFNAAGRDSVLKAQGSSLSLALLSSRDAASTQADSKEYCGFQIGIAPYLSFTYTEASSPSSPTRRTPFANDPTPIFRNDPIPIWRR